MAIQRGIALSAFSDTTAGLTLSQARLSSWIAAAERVRVRVWTQLHSRGRATPWSVGEGVCALWAGRPGAGVELMASMDLRNASHQQACGPTDEQWQRRWRFALHHASAGVGQLDGQTRPRPEDEGDMCLPRTV